ncbi:hypothetical protein AC1031_019559 [Aphanomyces cochlioides]|nr:hypothetical protein AC1031_019559 [Aphanomyces cochlioides]
MDDDDSYNITTNPWGNLQEFFPKVIAPTVPLSADLTELHTFLMNQKPSSDSDAELKQMSKKELESKIRVLENWNFRLYLDEGREMQRGQHLQVLSGDFPNGRVTPTEATDRRRAKRQRSSSSSDE